MMDPKQALAPLTPPDCDLRDVAFMPLALTSYPVLFIFQIWWRHEHGRTRTASEGRMGRGGSRGTESAIVRNGPGSDCRTRFSHSGGAFHSQHSQAGYGPSATGASTHPYRVRDRRHRGPQHHSNLEKKAVTALAGCPSRETEGRHA